MQAEERDARIEELTISILSQVPQKILEAALTQLPTQQLNLALAAVKKEAADRSKPKCSTKVEQAQVLPFDLHGKIPLPVVNQALDVFRRFESGAINPPRKNYDRNVRSLNVGGDYRLLSKDDCASWVLLTHADYDTQLKIR